MQLDIQQVNQAIADGLIFQRLHPTIPNVGVLKYTPACQYSRTNWTPLTKLCRGLVYDTQTGEVLARGFEKFFNLDELASVGEQLPNLPYEVFEKVDGSLIMYSFHPTLNTGIVNSVGSFESDQAKKATELLDTKYKHRLISLAVFSKHKPGNWTFIFELIYPENKIVVDYGEREELVLLAIKEADSGEEVDYETLKNLWIPVTTRYDVNLDYLKEHQAIEFGNCEGFVVKFSNNYRVKIKYDEYVRLHKIVTEFHDKDVLQMLRDHSDLNTKIANIPDELYQHIQTLVTQYTEYYQRIEYETVAEYQRILSILPADYVRKDFALEAIKYKYKQVLFAMLDNKPTESLYWDIVEEELIK